MTYFGIEHGNPGCLAESRQIVGTTLKELRQAVMFEMDDEEYDDWTVIRPFHTITRKELEKSKGSVTVYRQAPGNRLEYVAVYATDTNDDDSD